MCKPAHSICDVISVSLILSLFSSCLSLPPSLSLSLFLSVGQKGLIRQLTAQRALIGAEASLGSDV